MQVRQEAPALLVVGVGDSVTDSRLLAGDLTDAGHKNNLEISVTYGRVGVCSPTPGRALYQPGRRITRKGGGWILPRVLRVTYLTPPPGLARSLLRPHRTQDEQALTYPRGHSNDETHSCAMRGSCFARSRHTERPGSRGRSRLERRTGGQFRIHPY